MARRVKHEKLFVFFSDANAAAAAAASEKGKMQFVAHQSKGRVPQDPDPYYIRLSNGKKAFDLLCSEYHKLFMSDEWWGFTQLWLDWKGNRWVLPYLCKWYRELPKWLGEE